MALPSLSSCYVTAPLAPPPPALYKRRHKHRLSPTRTDASSCDSVENVNLPSPGCSLTRLQSVCDVKPGVERFVVEPASTQPLICDVVAHM